MLASTQHYLCYVCYVCWLAVTAGWQHYSRLSAGPCRCQRPVRRQCNERSPPPHPCAPSSPPGSRTTTGATGKLQVSGSGLVSGPSRTLPGTSYCSSCRRLHTLQREEPPMLGYPGHLPTNSPEKNPDCLNHQDHRNLTGNPGTSTDHTSGPTTRKTT